VKEPCDNGGQCWKAQDGDTWETFAKATGIGVSGLKAFFVGQVIESGHVYDVSGYAKWQRMQIDEFIESQRRYAENVQFGIGGGLSNINKAKAGLGLLSRFGRWLGFGKKAQVVEEAIEEVPVIGRLPVPPTPYGISLKTFGQVMRWGTGSAEARARMASLTREELESQGISREIAEAWREFYRNEMRRVPENHTAAGRADLMQRAVELLTDY